jgi:hypothetical protein
VLQLQNVFVVAPHDIARDQPGRQRSAQRQTADQQPNPRSRQSPRLACPLRF